MDLRRLVTIAVVCGGLFFGARWLGLLDKAPARAYKKFAFFRDHRQPPDARLWATGPGLDAVLPQSDRTIDSASHKVTRVTYGPGETSATVQARAEVCTAGVCVRTIQTAEVCKLDIGWRVCGFSESPAP